MKLSMLATAVIVSSFFGLLVQAQPQVVAEVGDGHEITVGDLEMWLEARPDVFYGLPREGAYRHALEEEVTRHLKQIDLFESGLARDSALLRGAEREVTEELVLAYGKDQYEARYLNEETIREEHADMGRVVFYRQIVLNKPPNTTPAALDSLRMTVSRIRQQLDAGTPFEALVQRYSEDGASAQLGGAAKPVIWRNTLNDPRAFLLYHLSPGDVRSLEGVRSFSIVQVERIEQVPVPPLEEVRDEIVGALNGRHAARATESFRGEWYALIDTVALRWNPDALEQVVAWSNTPGFYEDNYEATVRQYLDEHDDADVLSDGRGEVRFSDLPRLFDEVLTLNTSGNHDTEFIQEFILEAVRNDRLAERARALGLEDKILSADTQSPVLAYKFLRFYNQRRIEDRIPEPTEAALRDFYEAYDDSLFYQLATVYTEVIVRSDEDELEALWNQVQQGTPFEEASSRRLIRSFERTRDGEIVTRFNPEPPYLGEVAFGLEEGEMAGPIAYDDAKEGRLYAIVLATGRLKERQLAFEEVRDRVEEAFIEHHRARLAAEVAADLRARYPVTVHRDVLDRAIAGPSASGSP